MIRVLVVNDKRTPMEFVVSVLEQIFGLSRPEAVQTMLDAHEHGSAVCGIYEEDAQAQSIVSSAIGDARQHGYPLDFLVLPIPFWERAGACVFNMVMKVAPKL